MKTKKLLYIVSACLLFLLSMNGVKAQSKSFTNAWVQAYPSSGACSNNMQYIFSAGGTATGYQAGPNMVTAHLFFGDGKDTTVMDTLRGSINGESFYSNLNHFYKAGTYQIKAIFVMPDGLSDTVKSSIKITVCRTISGKVYKDKNSNCIFDSSDVLVYNAPLRLLDSASNVLQMTYTDYKGYYQFTIKDTSQKYIVAINATSTPSYNSYTAICPVSGSYSIASYPALNKDFAVSDTAVNRGVHANWYFSSINDCSLGQQFLFQSSMIAVGYKTGNLLNIRFDYGDGKDSLVNYVVKSNYDTATFNFTHRYNSAGNYNLKFLLVGPDGKRDSVLYASGVILNVCKIISGNVYKDKNSNCIFDSSDVFVYNAPLRLLDSASNLLQMTYTDYKGYYQFTIQDTSQKYTVAINATSTPSYNSLTSICPTSGSYTISSYPATNKDFAVKDSGSKGIYVNWYFYNIASCNLAQQFQFNPSIIVEGYKAGDYVNIRFDYGDGKDSLVNYIVKSAYDTNAFSFTHQYNLSGNYSLKFLAVGPDGKRDSVLYSNAIILKDTCGYVSGTVYFDLNNNCVFDAGDKPAQYYYMSLLDNGQNIDYTYTDSSGYYYFSATKGSGHSYVVQYYDVRNSHSICPTSGQYTISKIPSSGNDFGIACKNGYDLTGYVGGWGFRPGNNGYLYVGVENVRCQGINSTIKLVKSSLLAVVNSNPPVDAMNGDTLIWHKNNFTGADYFYAYIDVATASNATISDSIKVKLILEPIAGDSFPSDNSTDYVFPIKNSWDPNMKMACANGNTAREIIPMETKEILYTVHFQNTGNAAAYNISVEDTLDKNVDPNTIQIIGSSHKMKVDMLPGNILKFNFKKIMLPDNKTNEPGSHGYAAYVAKLKPGLVAGTVIKNTAYIYFDYNPAVITNTTHNQLVKTNGIAEINKSEKSLQLFPNPSNDELTIMTKNDVIGGEILLVDMIGTTVLKTTATSSLMKVNTSKLPAGMYLLMLNKGNESYKSKITIAH